MASCQQYVCMQLQPTTLQQNKGHLAATNWCSVRLEVLCFSIAAPGFLLFVRADMFCYSRCSLVEYTAFVEFKHHWHRSRLSL